MNTQKIWVVWISDGGEPDADWDLYDLCFSEEAANKSLKEGKQEYPESRFIIDICTGHD